MPTPPAHAGYAARPLADAILAAAAAGGEAAAAARELHMRLLRTLDLRAPEALDAAVDAALPAARQAPAAGEGGEGEGGEGDDEESQRRQRILGLLTAAFEGTARCPLLEAGTTVLLAAEAPSAAVRQLVSWGSEAGLGGVSLGASVLAWCIPALASCLRGCIPAAVRRGGVFFLPPPPPAPTRGAAARGAGSRWAPQSSTAGAITAAPTAGMSALLCPPATPLE